MKVCTCGSSKWKTSFETKIIQCLKCYKKYSFLQVKKLKENNKNGKR